MIDIYWKVPGGEWVKAIPTAKELKAIGARIRVNDRAGFHKFDITHKDNWGDERFPWQVRNVIVVGSREAYEADWVVDEFPSLRAALSDARRRVRERDHLEAK